MEITDADITLQDIEIHSFETMTEYQSIDNEKKYIKEPKSIYKRNKAEKRFITAIKKRFSLHFMHLQKDNERTGSYRKRQFYCCG